MRIYWTIFNKVNGITTEHKTGQKKGIKGLLFPEGQKHLSQSPSQELEVGLLNATLPLSNQFMKIPGDMRVKPAVGDQRMLTRGGVEGWGVYRGKGDTQV